MKLPHWIGVVLALIATGLVVLPTAVPSLASLAPVCSIVVAALIPIVTGILGSLPSWFPKVSPPNVSTLMLGLFARMGALSILIGAGFIAVAVAGCAAFAKDEPVVAADIAKAIDMGCAADVVASAAFTSITPIETVLAAVHLACPLIKATDTELATFASTFVSHPAVKLANALDAGSGG